MKSRERNRYAASLPLFMGTGQLSDIGMRERQEVREEERDETWGWTERIGKEKEGPNEKRREESEFERRQAKLVKIIRHEGEERRRETDNKGQVGQKPVKQVIGRQAEMWEKENLQGERKQRAEKKQRENRGWWMKNTGEEVRAGNSLKWTEGERLHPPRGEVES